MVKNGGRPKREKSPSSRLDVGELREVYDVALRLRQRLHRDIAEVVEIETEEWGPRDESILTAFVQAVEIQQRLRQMLREPEEAG